ncbi:MAG: HAMP domain-containing histidine kinase [Bacteroidales bacterium]|nr:HAMP domain-containing histidine kinase [Bacteroidales bacterium]MBN2819660.1 HAMP domain-containing histidine kinase [Bacteroidales bacterium]
MFERLKILFLKFQSRLPENRVKADYYEMLQKLKKLESQVENNAKQLELAKTSFLKNLYHEIRTPLNAIIGFTNLVANRKSEDPDVNEEFQDIINQSSGDFLRIMDDIIQASLLEAGMIKITPEDFSIGELLKEVHDYYSIRKHILQKNNIALLKNIPEKFNDLVIVGDRYRVQQVMSQLLENALKFTDKGIIEYGFYPKNNNLVFFVKDTGRGKLEGNDKFIFGRFSKLEISDDSKNGLGLGLSICKKLVDLMDGKIWYNSNYTQGTCFYFSFPLIKSKASAPPKSNRGNMFENVLRVHNSLAV